MAGPLRILFDEGKLNAEDDQIVRVLVSLKYPPDEACLASVKMKGLYVRSINGNKLVGEISRQHIATLERHDAVVDVERSVKLQPTNVSKLER